MKDDMPGIPKVSIGCVDVRDTALAHVRALKRPEVSNGKRYLLVEGSYWFEDIINILR